MREKRRGKKGLHPSMEQPVSEGKLRGADGGRPQGSHLHFVSSLITAEPLKEGGFDKRDKRSCSLLGEQAVERSTALQVRASCLIRGWDWQHFPLEELALGAVKPGNRPRGKSWWRIIILLNNRVQWAKSIVQLFFCTEGSFDLPSNEYRSNTDTQLWPTKVSLAI